MTAAAAEPQPTVEERLTGLERALASLAEELRDSGRCAAHRPEQERAEQPEESGTKPEERTTAGANALVCMDRHHPAALAVGDQTQETT